MVLHRPIECTRLNRTWLGLDTNRSRAQCCPKDTTHLEYFVEAESLIQSRPRRNAKDLWSLKFFVIVPEQIRNCLGATTAERCASNVAGFGSAQLVIPRLGGNGLQLSTVRILVVDDFEKFRQFVVEMLGKRPELQVVGEASDGLEALQKAVELRPDLILLDISLPSLNGIEVARQMRSLVPESKIIFLTRESSSDVVQEALGLGARGYVTKNMVLADLFAAVETVLVGMTFVSNL